MIWVVLLLVFCKFCYYCILSVCCRDVFYEFVVNFMLLLMIFKDDFKILEMWYYRFFELIYFFFEREKKLRGKNNFLMFKIEIYNILIVNKMD